MFCSTCGNGMAVAAAFCDACAKSPEVLEGKTEASPRRKAYSLDLYAAIVGPTHQEYYLSRFSRYSATGQTGLSWHWPSFFLTLPWLVYRKMWLCAIVYFFLPYTALVSGSTMLAVLAQASGIGDILAPVGLAVWIVGYLFLPPLLANGVYFDHCRDKIKEAATASPSKDWQVGALSVRGGTSGPLAIFIALFCIATSIGMLAAVSIPAYQAYMGKAQLAQAERYGRSAADSVAAFYIEHERLPESLEQAGFEVQVPQAVSEISMDRNDGTLTIAMLSEISGVKGGSLMLAPSLNEEQEVVWSCWSDDISPLYLQASCVSTLAEEGE